MRWKNKKANLENLPNTLFIITILILVIVFGVFFIKKSYDAIAYDSLSQTDTLLLDFNKSTTLSKIPTGNFVASSKNLTWLNFDGVNDAINMSNKPAHDIYQAPFTISFWLYPINITNNVLPRILEKRTSFIAIMGNESNGRFQEIALEMQNESGTNTAEFWSLSDVTMNTWQHWAFVYNGSNGTWYKDGASDGIREIYIGGTFVRSINTSTQEMFIAKRRTDNARNLNGSLDEIRFYNTNLSASDISLINQSGRKQNKTLFGNSLDNNLVLYLPMNENQGTTSYDVSLSNNGTFLNSPIYQNDGINKTLVLNTNYNQTTNTFIILDLNLAWNQINTTYNFNSESLAKAGANKSLTGFDDFADFVPLIVLAVASSVIIGLILIYFLRRKIR